MSCTLIRCKYQCSSFIQDADSSIGGRRFHSNFGKVLPIKRQRITQKSNFIPQTNTIKKLVAAWNYSENKTERSLLTHRKPTNLNNFTSVFWKFQCSSELLRNNQPRVPLNFYTGVPYGSWDLLNVRTDRVCRRLYAIAWSLNCLFYLAILDVSQKILINSKGNHQLCR
jgi:hypothetical protein